MNEASEPDKKTVSRKSRILAVAIPLVMLTVITLLAYANAWPNILVSDDKGFAGPFRPHSLDGFYNIFNRDLWAANGIHGGLYRPLLLLSLWLETGLFGNWLAGFHLSNIFQHLLVTLLVYGFLRHLLRLHGNKTSSPDLYALVAALLFAVHPVHTEVVNSIFNRSESMVALFGVAGLWWLFHYLDSHPGRAWFGLGVAYFLGLLSKESAVFIPVLAVALILLLKTDDLAVRIRKCLPVFYLVLPLALYLGLRIHALAQPGTGSAHQAATGGGELDTIVHWVAIPGIHRLYYVLVTLGEAFKVILWPYPMHLYYDAPPTPERLVYAALNPVLIIIALVQIKKKRYSLAAGLAFFYIAMLPSTRIFEGGNAPFQLAERYLYFPSVGLTITLAFALRALAHRFGSRIVLGLALPLLVLLTALTWNRNTNWSSDASLYETEYQLGSRDSNILRLLTSTHTLTRNYSRVASICDENRKAQEVFSFSRFVLYCANAYEHQRRYKDAEHAYLLPTKRRSTRIGASITLAQFYMRRGRRQDAEKSFNNAISWTSDPAEKAVFRAEMVLTLNPDSSQQLDLAKSYLEEALRLHPHWVKAESLLKSLDKALETSPTEQINERIH